MTPEVRVLPEGTQDALWALPRPGVFSAVRCPASRCASEEVAFARLVLARHETEVGAHGAAPLESPRVFQGEHEGQSRECSYPVNLSQQFRLQVDLIADSRKPTWER